MPTLPVTSGGKRNNGGAIAYVVGSSTGKITADTGFTKMNVSKPKMPDPETNVDIDAGNATRAVYKPYNPGNYATMVRGEYVIHGYSTKLCGVANTAIQSGASGSNGRRSIHKTIRIRTVHLSQFTFAAASGTDAYGNRKVTMGVTYTRSAKLYDNSVAIGNTNGIGPDDAATPTRAIPGEFILLETGKTPTLKDYPAR